MRGRTALIVAGAWLSSLALGAVLPAASFAAFTIDGRVFEDKAGDGLPVGQAVNDAANPGTNAGIAVQLYLDNGDSVPGAGDRSEEHTSELQSPM